MRKVALYISMSLDGYLADENRGVDWLDGDGSNPEALGSYEEFYETVDDLIIGYKTFNQVRTELSPDKWVYSGKKSYVFTNRDLESDREDIIFTKEDPKELVSKLKEQKGKNIWVVGGANLLNEFIEEDLIDEYIISIIPTILGKGIKLFTEHLDEKKLRLISTNTYNGIVDLKYERRK